MKSTDQRNRAMIAMAQCGMTYAEIGAAFGVTRERVRQILNRAGITGSTTRSARAATKQEALAADRKRILDWAQQNPGLSAHDAEEALALKDGRVSEALGSDVARVFVRQKPKAHVQYTDAVIVESLRSASVLQGEPMSKVAYDEYVEVFGGPSGVLLMKRFGSWKAACRAAALAVHPSRGNTRRRWSQGQLVEVLIEYFRSPGARGTLDDYCRWAGEDKPVRPSGPTILNRFGSWTAAKRAALAAGSALAA